MVLRAAGTYTPTTGLVDALSGSSSRTSGRDALLHDIADRAFRLELGSLGPCGFEVGKAHPVPLLPCPCPGKVICKVCRCSFGSKMTDNKTASRL